MDRLRVEQLNLYPVKSLRGIAVPQWPLTPQGLKHDRHWMIILPNGRFVTQRQVPHMALIDTAIEGEQLHLSQSGYGSVVLPLSGVASADSAIQSGTVWRDECDVQEASAEASAWLTQRLNLGHALTLVRLAPKAQRPQSQPQRFGADTHTHFADAAPFLVTNTASLTALNSALQARQLGIVDGRRFRANIVISGVEPFAEHGLTYLQHPNGDQLHLRDHCERCIMTTIDPDTGLKHPEMEPYHTLAGINPMPNKPQAPAFGVNATLRLCDGQTESLWKVGEPLTYVR